MPLVCPTRTYNVQSLLPHSSHGPALDDEFSANLAWQLRPLGIQIADIQATAYMHRMLRYSVSEGDRVQRLSTQHRHMFNLLQGPFPKQVPVQFPKPMPVQQTARAIDSSVSPVPCLLKKPNIDTVFCSEALTNQGDEPSQVLSDCLLNSVVSCASEILVADYI